MDGGCTGADVEAERRARGDVTFRGAVAVLAAVDDERLRGERGAEVEVFMPVS